MKHNKFFLSKALSLVAYTVLGFGVYTAVVTFPSCYSWWFEYEPAGLQYLGIIIFSAPAFMLAMILFYLNHLKLGRSVVPVIISIICLVSTVFTPRPVVGTIIFFLMPIGVFFVFLWDFLELRRRPKLFITLSTVTGLLVLLLGGILGQSIYYQIKGNIIYNTDYKYLTVNQQQNLLYQGFDNKYFQIIGAERMVQIMPMGSIDIDVVEKLYHLYKGDLVKMAILNIAVKQNHLNVNFLDDLSFSKNEIKKAIKACQPPSRFPEMAPYIFKKTVQSTRLTKQKKIELIRGTIHDYYKENLTDYNNREMIIILMNSLSELDPNQYIIDSSSKILVEKNPNMSAALLRSLNKYVIDHRVLNNNKISQKSKKILLDLYHNIFKIPNSKKVFAAYFNYYPPIGFSPEEEYKLSSALESDNKKLIRQYLVPIKGVFLSVI